jgi:DNA-directed RNA polymerase subunit K/omega
VVLASLRAAQLMRGCRAKVDGEHKPVVTALIEVSAGVVGPWCPPAELPPDA